MRKGFMGVIAVLAVMAVSLMHPDHAHGQICFKCNDTNSGCLINSGKKGSCHAECDQEGCTCEATGECSVAMLNNRTIRPDGSVLVAGNVKPPFGGSRAVNANTFDVSTQPVEELTGTRACGGFVFRRAYSEFLVEEMQVKAATLLI